MKLTERKTSYNLNNDLMDVTNKRYINAPLESLKGWEEMQGTLVLKKLLKNNINDTKTFYTKEDDGSIYEIKEEKVNKINNKRVTVSVFTTADIAKVESILDLNLVSLPGINEKAYNYCKKLGIITISEFNAACIAGTFKNLPAGEVSKNDIDELTILTERNKNKGLLRSYHTSPDVNVASYIFNHTWGDGPNSQAYGTGMYCCWTKSSAFHDTDAWGRRNWRSKDDYIQWGLEAGNKSVDENGAPIAFRWEVLSDVTDYFIFNWVVYKQTHDLNTRDPITGAPITVSESNYIDYQNKKFGLHMNSHTDFWHFDWKNKKFNPHYEENPDPKTAKPCVRGIIFNGRNDGDVVVIYDTYHALPTRFSKGLDNEWYEIGDASYNSQAALAAQNIYTDTSIIFAKAQHAYEKLISNILEDTSGAGDVDETEFISSNGTNYVVKDSVETDTISGPLARETGNTVFNKYEIKDCLYAKSYHFPFVKVNTLHVINTDAADCETMTANSSKKRIFVNDEFVVQNVPNAHLPWAAIEGTAPKSKFKVNNVGMYTGSEGELIKNFEQAYFINLILGGHDNSYEAVDENGQSNSSDLTPRIICNDCSYIHFKKVTGDCLTVSLGTRDIESLTFEDCNINRVNIFAAKEGMTINKLRLGKGSNIDEIKFIIQTANRGSIYKDSDEIRKFSYSDSELVDALSNDKDDFIDEINIKSLEVI